MRIPESRTPLIGKLEVSKLRLNLQKPCRLFAPHHESEDLIFGTIIGEAVYENGCCKVVWLATSQ
jgi:hypothetical protein